jgi:hypothetical protein
MSFRAITTHGNLGAPIREKPRSGGVLFAVLAAILGLLRWVRSGHERVDSDPRPVDRVAKPLRVYWLEVTEPVDVLRPLADAAHEAVVGALAQARDEDPADKSLAFCARTVTGS